MEVKVKKTKRVKSKSEKANKKKNYESEMDGLRSQINELTFINQKLESIISDFELKFPTKFYKIMFSARNGQDAAYQNYTEIFEGYSLHEVLKNLKSKMIHPESLKIADIELLGS